MIFTPSDWQDYELVDTGDGEKLERWGKSIVARPEPRIIWEKGNPDVWKIKGELAEQIIGYKKLKFRVKKTKFGHTGVFPEQAVNWDWIPGAEKILNLFAYTGGATLAAALAGAHVTHVDASRPAMSWAAENAKLSGVSNIRWICDDVMKFVNREIRRGTKYDGIMMDPPRFGRGASGEVWKIENHLPKLVKACAQLLSPTPTFFLINAYTADLSHTAIGNLLSGVLEKEVESGELGLKESSAGRILPAGIFARWKS